MEPYLTGAPQGSVLSPALFSLYTHAFMIKVQSKVCFCLFMYADGIGVPSSEKSSQCYLHSVITEIFSG